MKAVPDRVVIESLQNAGILLPKNSASFEPLAGGVSSDIWRVDILEQVYCVKRALPKLKVKADWFAPVERNLFEVAWYQVANEIVPGCAPSVIVHDKVAMLFVMDFLDPGSYKNWKLELRDGRADQDTAAEVGDKLARIHAGTAGRESIKPDLPDLEIFHSIRLEPYLETVAVIHPDLEKQLISLCNRTACNRLAMIHGDVSPKNILLGPSGAVFIDAECACIGDPAFDLAFCLNHFLLKCLWKPNYQEDFLNCYTSMYSSYLHKVTWESPLELEFRAATLLPALFLARIDGKSPVEYIADEDDKKKVRRCARSLLFSSPGNLSDVANAWKHELAA